MPSSSPAQARLMRAAAHTPGGFGGVPQSVGREFAKADAASPKSPAEHMAKRRKQGATYREIGGEHGVSKSTAHRNVMRQGFIKMGKAS